MNSRLEGQLSKWTNALKGWQQRWLSVDQQQGVLHYYTSEDRKKAPPRGSLHLWGAVIAPSDEDSHSFTVNGANGEAYKLRAADAKERQYWVSRLRNEIERCTTVHSGYVKTQVFLRVCTVCIVCSTWW
ncbi:Oxysterol-binding protein-related protein 11 [Geodia barretti]|nr:Oxysterol-binding protein-related protein 11 [Geodia barretti]